MLGGLASVSGVALTALAGWLIVRAAAMPSILTLTVAMVGVRTFGLARPALGYVERLRSHDAALRLLAEERVTVYDALVPLTPGSLGRRRGDVLAAMVDDVDCVLDEELRVRLPLRAFAVTAILATATTALLEPIAGAVTAATCLAALGCYALARRGASAAEADLVAARADLSDAVVEATQTAEELVMWQAEDRALDAVEAAGARVGAASAATARRLGAARALALLATGVAVGVLALLLHGDVASGALSGPVFALLLLVPLALAEACTGLADAGAARARTAAAQRRLREIAQRPPAVADPPRPRPAPDTAELRLDAVGAGWGGRPVLADLDLRIAPGEKVAVVGPSGSGKSTLAGLLLRFRDPDAGAVRLGGVDYPEMALASVRERVGYVDDDPHVFGSSLVENVRFARPGATDAEVEQALRRAHLGTWLDQLPDGVRTRLGDGGASVSGGERARLAVARALLAAPGVIVLDEPVAHLDSATADEIAGEVLRQERTVVWISHAAAGLDQVDRVINLG